MDCAAVKPKMEALASATLPDAERAPVEQHIAICEGCRLELELVRAIGSQEAPAGGDECDWSLDRIFNAEGAGVPAPPSADSAGTPASTAEGATLSEESFSLGDGDASGPSADEAEALVGEPDPPTSGWRGGEENASPTQVQPEREPERASNWSFEPADAKPEYAPPEKSLFFAEEALTRRKDIDRKKSSTLRLVLGVTGGVVGAVLLAVSAWIAFHITQPSGEPEVVSVPHRPASVRQPSARRSNDSTSAQPGAASAGVAPATQGSPERPPTAAQGSPEQLPSAAQNTQLAASSSGQPSPLPAPPRAASPAIRAASSPTTASTSPSSVRPMSQPTVAVRSAKQTAQLGAPAAAKPPTRPVSHPVAAGSAPVRLAPEPGSNSEAGARPVASAPPSAVTHSAASAPPAVTPPVASAPVESSAPASRLPEQPASAAAPEQSASVPSTLANPAPAPPAASPSVVTHTAPNSQTLAPAPPPESHATAKPAPEPSGAPQAPEVTTPIDRLHLATAAAEQRGDIVGLRQLRVTWKGFMAKMGVGPDRARARREYAECLWAIQSVTGKRADQKDALTAYREYILSAPAGGADSRSVSRLRQLEDALSERQ